MTDSDRLHWDRRYRERCRNAFPEPMLPAVFVAFTDLFPGGGRGVDVACGDGAAALWLGRRGLDVWGYDISPVAISLATEAAGRFGLSDRCRFGVADLDRGLPVGDPADVLLCNNFRDARLDGALIDRLAPGGLLAISVLGEVGAGPGRFRARPGELLDAFATLQVIASGESAGQAWLLARRR